MSAKEKFRAGIVLVGMILFYTLVVFVPIVYVYYLNFVPRGPSLGNSRITKDYTIRPEELYRLRVDGDVTLELTANSGSIVVKKVGTDELYSVHNVSFWPFSMNTKVEVAPLKPGLYEIAITEGDVWLRLYSNQEFGVRYFPDETFDQLITLQQYTNPIFVVSVFAMVWFAIVRILLMDILFPQVARWLRKFVYWGN